MHDLFVEAVTLHLARDAQPYALLDGAGHRLRAAEPLEVERARAVAEYGLIDARAPANRHEVGEDHFAYERAALTDLQRADRLGIAAIVVARGEVEEQIRDRAQTALGEPLRSFGADTRQCRDRARDRAVGVAGIAQRREISQGICDRLAPRVRIRERLSEARAHAFEQAARFGRNCERSGAFGGSAHGRLEIAHAICAREVARGGELEGRRDRAERCCEGSRVHVARMVTATSLAKNQGPRLRPDSWPCSGGSGAQPHTARTQQGQTPLPLRLTLRAAERGSPEPRAASAVSVRARLRSKLRCGWRI